ncbi:16S rRNA (cytidine(1402)-2'-O)-methyltransferase [Salicibibacter halophilus]|uniref:Ribosomal RNA small subunit methyltransferase I n=1 Tax=Salicibibacter halophilus TaxID=2502791 RepID=A0A514LML0_9BACI|nr:16S rRNA (cytidine(1402)-2'-O)-methyltransferase [Salicibibacter halophilus]QDI93102.1 16S rRNA (cytidine(1402)-2'-O)-methyltransferase [Salicibibacter halophilus]
MLYLVPTPIGNLEDMTYRAVRVLGEVDLILAEDTRQTRKLLSHYGIHTPMKSMHEHNEEKRTSELLETLQGGEQWALVSDAGAPLVSDPGERLVNACIQAGVTVVPLPGSNAAVTALIASGFGGGPFHFHGFLPRKKKERKETLAQLGRIQVPIVFYESPYRLTATIEQLAEIWANREAVVARELTKHYEEFHRGRLEELAQIGRENGWRGECCLIVAGASDEELEEDQASLWWKEMAVPQHVKAYEEQGWGRKAALKQCAVDRKMSKNDVYAIYHGLE